MVERLILAAEEPSPIAVYPAELVLGLVSFAILFFVLWKFAVPRFEKLYEERTDAIEGGLKRAQEAQEQADRLKKEYEEQVAGLRAEAARIRDDARAEGQQIKAELRAEAEQEAARIKARGDEQIAAARAAAERSLRGEVGGLSVQLAERLLREQLADDSRRSATIDSFLADLGETGQRSGAN
ncbi:MULTISPECIES: F0F1 ATP synthase subunit B [Pseudonocardia]|uniref:ATP synthase subunit b n=2 Tax=Pseudonocardia TaxID=1847 RepID=A0A1Y2N7J8_PSEAH|nr:MULTISPECIES: F0F1 ATP synthase subunit B [Pseudonocardia]OSY43450.1 ATP synthase subunit b [Pseudonocardia autotrophica]BBG04299.1 ATP synthase subunit b [Pseudonocardia autotrophica]GEC25558.1 ATP synthase subunit b [Pseudonocardia saturnea]